MGSAASRLTGADGLACPSSRRSRSSALVGSLIAGIGLAIVVAFRGSGVVNLATGAIAMLGAYVFYDLRTAGKLLLPPIPFAPHRLSLGDPWPTLPAMLGALAVCAVTGALFDILVAAAAHRLAAREAPRVARPLPDHDPGGRRAPLRQQRPGRSGRPHRAATRGTRPASMCRRTGSCSPDRARSRRPC